MKSKVVAFVTILMLSLPVFVSAQSGWNFDQQIVPEGCNGPNCTCDHLVQLANNVMNFGIYFAVIMSAFLFIYAGFRYMNNAANPVEKQEVKNLLLNILIGLVLALGAWLIVSTLVNSVGNNAFGRAVFSAMCSGVGR